jgi:uncharacterized protein (TIGR03083 family)
MFEEQPVSRDGLSAAEALTQRYLESVSSLTPEEWARPSRCAGWSVQDLVAHTGSNFKVLVEPPPAPPAGSPTLTAEQGQDLLVEERRGWSSDQVQQELEQYAAPALAVLTALQDEPTASAPLAIAELGTYPMHALADAFAFDLWCHLYVDLLGPEGPVDRPAPQHDDAILAPGIGWMLTGLPQMCPSVSKRLDRPLVLRLTGPGGGEWTLVPGSPLLSVQPGATADAAATVTSRATDFVLWATTRSAWRDSVELEGDRGYAATVLDEVDIV